MTTVSSTHVKELNLELQRLDARLEVANRGAVQVDLPEIRAALEKNIEAIEALARTNPAARKLLDQLEALKSDAHTKPGAALRRTIEDLGILLARIPSTEPDVTAFIHQHGLAMNPLELFGAHGGLLDEAIRQARAQVVRLDPKPEAVDAKHTAQIAGEAYNGEAWDLYGAAKKAREAGNLDLAAAQLELSLALYLKMRDSAEGHALNVAENRIGMILHQLGLVALAGGKDAAVKAAGAVGIEAVGQSSEAVHRLFETQALGMYQRVKDREDHNTPPYHPAPWMNSICSHAQLGNESQVRRAIDGMIASCGNAEQVQKMVGVVLGDGELQAHPMFKMIEAHLAESVKQA